MAAEPPFPNEVAPVRNGKYQPYLRPMAARGQQANPVSETGTTIHHNRQPYSYDSVAPTLYLDGKTLHKLSSVKEYLSLSFDLSRLHKIQKRLWLAGLPLPARSLHRQKMLGRDIVITDQSDLHLTWRESTIFVKPLWKPLLDYDFWRTELCNGDLQTYKSAAGLVLSYVWLITSKSDLQIAKDHKLVPKRLKWKMWAKFARSFLERNSMIGLDTQVAKRYEYGELRIYRLNMIYRFAPEMFLQHLFRGYFYGYNQYSAFFGRNFAWAAVAVLYVGLLLTAMQTALAVNPTKEDTYFQQVVYGFSVFSMVSVLFFSVLALGYFVFAFMMNLVFTRRKVKEQSKQRENQQPQLVSSEP
ncbi:hypothetical protein DER46DRAFT_663330 [Fusarium sp. MPI-SDFR-AT-0072]|nr:hypothetical protein DER46DRAFT_663330 [Fusarium sp. MPI-SDFR-AT-0072]